MSTSLLRLGRVAVLKMQSPPVNALGLSLRQSILSSLRQVEADPEVHALVLAGGNESSTVFSAGADIAEFNKGGHLTAPGLGEVIEAIANSRVHTVAAVEGVAFGGGLELALGCGKRVFGPSASCAMSEVLLGLLPGAGGTQRLPRLVGCETAIKMMTNGAPVGAAPATAAGLADERVDVDGQVVSSSGEIMSSGVEVLAGLTATQSRAVAVAEAMSEGSKRAHQLDVPQPAADLEAFFAGARAAAGKAARGQTAPLAVVDAVRAACELPFEAGLQREGELFEMLNAGPQAGALQHAFFAERQMGKVKGLSAAPSPIASVAVIGGGTMGTGIAICFANAGVKVSVVDANEEALGCAMATVAKTYSDQVAKGRLTEAKAAARTGLVGAVGSIEDAAVAEADIVVEAVSERMEVKRAVFAKLDATCKPGALLCSNTSTLDIDEIAAATSRPEAVCGTHFFSPAHVMPLLENVRGSRASETTLATVMAMGKLLRKKTVLVGNCFGFVGNRCLEGYIREAMFLLEEGCTPKQVDAPIRQLGLAMGPLQMSDLAGNDIGYSIRKDFGWAAGPEKYYGAIPDKLVESGRLGQKTKKGWYDYSQGRAPVDDPEVEAMIVAHSKEVGISRREIAPSEVLNRCLLPLVNEGFKCIEEGIAQRESDVDMVFLFGYGWPRYLGGPLYWARHVRPGGLAGVAADIKAYGEAHPGLAHWTPSELLLKESQA